MRYYRLRRIVVHRRVYGHLRGTRHGPDLIVAPTFERNGVRPAGLRYRRRRVVRDLRDVPCELLAVAADLRPCAVPLILERHRTFVIAHIRRNSQLYGRTRSGDLARDEGRTAGLGPDFDALSRKDARQRDAVRPALTGDRLRSIVRLAGDGIARRLRARLFFDRNPLVAPLILERHRAAVETFVRRNREVHVSTRGQYRDIDKRLAAVPGAHLHKLFPGAVQRHDVRAARPGNVTLRSNLSARNAISSLRADADHVPLALPLVGEFDLTLVLARVFRDVKRRRTRIARLTGCCARGKLLAAHHRGAYRNACPRPIAVERDLERLSVHMDRKTQVRIDRRRAVQIFQRAGPHPVVALGQQFLVVQRAADADAVDIMAVALHVEVRGDVLAQVNIVIQALVHIRRLVRLDARVGGHRRSVVPALVLLPPNRGNLTPAVVADVPRVRHRAAARTRRSKARRFAVAVNEIRNRTRRRVIRHGIVQPVAGPRGNLVQPHAVQLGTIDIVFQQHVHARHRAGERHLRNHRIVLAHENLTVVEDANAREPARERNQFVRGGRGRMQHLVLEVGERGGVRGRQNAFGRTVRNNPHRVTLAALKRGLHPRSGGHRTHIGARLGRARGVELQNPDVRKTYVGTRGGEGCGRPHTFIRAETHREEAVIIGRSPGSTNRTGYRRPAAHGLYDDRIGHRQSGKRDIQLARVRRAPLTGIHVATRQQRTPRHGQRRSCRKYAIRYL